MFSKVGGDAKAGKFKRIIEDPRAQKGGAWVRFTGNSGYFSAQASDLLELSKYKYVVLCINDKAGQVGFILTNTPEAGAVMIRDANTKVSDTSRPVRSKIFNAASLVRAVDDMENKARYALRYLPKGDEAGVDAYIQL
ncbi:MAG: hypothetical protein ACYTEQ_01740 [Planctomycetota bacterium]|jgi:hypothetical protein